MCVCASFSGCGVRLLLRKCLPLGYRVFIQLPLVQNGGHYGDTVDTYHPICEGHIAEMITHIDFYPFVRQLQTMIEQSFDTWNRERNTAPRTG